MNGKLIPPSPPGDTLKEDWMIPLGLTAYRMARHLGITPSAMGELLAGKRRITPEMALRLERVTGASAPFWLARQAHYDLRLAAREKALQAKLAKLVPLPVAA